MKLIPSGTITLSEDPDRKAEARDMPDYSGSGHPVNKAYDPLSALKGAARSVLMRFYYRYRAPELFDGVEKFCLFLGYPRSGHTLVGAFVDANPEAVVALGGPMPSLLENPITRNKLYAHILERSRKRGKKTDHRYSIDPQWEGGRFDRLRVIGHKRAGEASRTFAAKLELLDVLRRTVGVPLVAVHTVRNPYDNISTISRKHGMSLADAIDYYFYMCAAVRVLKTRFGDREFLTVRHEDIIADPRREVRRLCEFLGLTADDGYVDDCAGIVYEKPHRSRYLVEWSPDHMSRVAQRIREYSYLADYTHDN